MHHLKRVTSELLRQFRLNQYRYSEKLKMATEQTESAQQLTDKDISEMFHDVDLCSELSILLNVQQNNGRPLPVFSFTERQIAEKYKKYTNTEPIALTLLGPKDVILEFDKRDDVVTASTKAQGLRQWDDMGVNLHCIAAPKAHLIKIFSKMNSLKKETQWLAKEKEELHLEKRQCEEQLATTISQMASKIDQLDRRFEDAPSIPSGIVTPDQLHEVASPQGEKQQVLVSAPTPQLVMSSGLPLFSGADPTPRDESTYEQWRFQVKGMRSSAPEHTVKTAVISSVRGEASEAISFAGFHAPLSDLLDAMEDRFGRKMTSDRLQQDFYQLQQEKGEKIQHFAGRLEKAFKKLQDLFPDRYQQRQLKEWLFHSMNQQTRDSMRYLYDQKTTTYEVLLAAMKVAETEWQESRGQYRMKQAMVTDTNELQELKERMDKLQATVKSTTAKQEKEKKKTPKSSPRKEDPRKTCKGPQTSSAGPFQPGQKPMQCHKCQGWGHGWRECATKGNVDWGRVRGELTPTVQKGPEPEKQ